MRVRDGVTIHPSSDVSDGAELGPGTRVWHQAQIREGAVIGRDCIFGKGSYVDIGVRVGDRCKVQNGAYLYHGFSLEDGVFIGPGAMLLNDKNPRAINPDGTLKSDADWKVSIGVIHSGASVGGGAIVLPGVDVGSFALIGSGAVVTKDVPNHGVVVGNPARLKGFVCRCGLPLKAGVKSADGMRMHCAADGTEVVIPLSTFAMVETTR